MILEINTSKYNMISLVFRDKDKIFEEKLEVAKSQSEQLLPLIDKLLTKFGYTLHDVSKIVVENKGGSFTSLRIGVITANTLAYSLKVPVISRDGTVKNIDKIDMVEPIYDREPNIT